MMTIPLPTRHGLMALNPLDVYIGGALLRFGEYSEFEAQFLAALVRPGNTVVEVGANIGALTLALARAVGPSGRVVAFEPQQLAYRRLITNATLNNLDHIEIWNMAVGSRDGMVQVPAINELVPNNHGGVALNPDDEKIPTYPAQMIPLDGMDLTACHLLKIDVEGMETEVLTGAQRTIAKHRPILYVENDRREKSAALLALLDELGYRLWWHHPPLYNPANWRGAEPDKFTKPGVVSMNMLGIGVEFDLEDVVEAPARAILGEPVGRSVAP